MPSLPTTAISADAPSASMYSSETIAVVGKYTARCRVPDSYRTLPSSSGTSLRLELTRSKSSPDKEARRWF
jgi:hypothetical protein